MECRVFAPNIPAAGKAGTGGGLCLGVHLGSPGRAGGVSDALLQGHWRLFINPISFFPPSLLLFCFVLLCYGGFFFL